MAAILRIRAQRARLAAARVAEGKRQHKETRGSDTDSDVDLSLRRPARSGVALDQTHPWDFSTRPDRAAKYTAAAPVVDPLSQCFVHSVSSSFFDPAMLASSASVAFGSVAASESSSFSPPRQRRASVVQREASRSVEALVVVAPPAAAAASTSTSSLPPLTPSPSPNRGAMPPAGGAEAAKGQSPQQQQQTPNCDDDGPKSSQTSQQQQPTKVACSKCGHKNRPADRFCGFCGTTTTSSSTK
jgi:hypothetical protein